MPAYETCSCNESMELRPTKAPNETLCMKAINLLECVCHIKNLVDRIDETLFCGNQTEKESNKPVPNCLESNIDLTFDTAKSIVYHLEKIVDRL